LETSILRLRGPTFIPTVDGGVVAEEDTCLVMVGREELKDVVVVKESATI
jgi:hypothetical protein